LFFLVDASLITVYKTVSCCNKYSSYFSENVQNMKLKLFTPLASSLSAMFQNGASWLRYQIIDPDGGVQLIATKLICATVPAIGTAAP
jgi:hypothetical protein